MENTHETVPQTFTKDSIVKFLHQKSIVGCIDSYNLSELLGTISPRMIRNFTQQGKLKPIDHQSRMYIYKVEDVAEWLLEYPRYIFVQKSQSIVMTDERFAELSAHIRNSVYANWSNSILKKMDIEDIVMEVTYQIMKKKYTGNVDDATLIYRELIKLWRKEFKKIETVNIEDIEEIGDTEADD